LIPAGTGFEEYRDTFVVSSKPEAAVEHASQQPVAVGQAGEQTSAGDEAGN
jgi:hypothetical protein